MLMHIPQGLSPEQSHATRAGLDAADWADRRVTASQQGQRIKNNRQLPENCPVALAQGHVILQALAANARFFSAALPLRTLPPMFNRYSLGETYGLHVDGSVRTIVGTAQRVRTDVSCTLFLSEPDDYDGGDLVVVDTYGVHEVKLPAGDMIVYPSTSLHRVEPVTRGERVASFFWTQSMVSDDGERAMLYELDQTIQKLRARDGETDETLALTGHYHNLLRKWAEV